MQTYPMTPPTIAIIGAGLAGLSCARQLHAAGLRITVFDKSRGLGGRLCTRRGNNWQADHGAQYFTARVPAFRQQVDDWLHAGVVVEWPITPAVLGQPAAGTQPDQHMAPARYVGLPGMSAPCKALATGLAVRSQHTVCRLHHSPAGWQLETVEHGLLPDLFSQVLVAVPAPQAASLLADSQPALAAVAAAQPMLPCWTVMVQPAADFAPGFTAAFVNDGPLRWIARNDSKPGRSGAPCWVLQANAEWSAAHLELPASEVAALLLNAFRVLGAPACTALSSHRWRYADCHASQHGSVWDTASGIGLCGDWLHGGKVEGAWLSGRHLAASVLGALQP
jgi:renalase